MADISIEPTQWVGIAAFGITVALCLWASVRNGAGWRGLAALHLTFCVEVVLGMRYRLHDAADVILQAQGRYASRQSLQIGLLAAVAAVLTLCLLLALLASRRRGALAAGLAGSALVLTLFGVETVSLHAIDALLYSRRGGIALVGWLWVGGAAITAASAWWAGRTARSRDADDPEAFSRRGPVTHRQ